LLGVVQIAQRPDVLLALNPLYGLQLLANSPWRSFRNRHLAVPRIGEERQAKYSLPTSGLFKSILRRSASACRSEFDESPLHSSMQPLIRANELSFETSGAQQRAEKLMKDNFWQDFLR
jgi:hypothetical protein